LQRLFSHSGRVHITKKIEQTTQPIRERKNYVVALHMSISIYDSTTEAFEARLEMQISVALFRLGAFPLATV
jgi:hypothetical protein